MVCLNNVSASNERSLLHESLQTIADAATALRDNVYWATKQTPLGGLVDRICDFMDENTTLIFWGGACLFAILNPPLYLSGFAIGLTVGSLMPYKSKAVRNIDFTALRQTIKVIVFLVSPWLGAFAYLVTALTPGFHSYRVYNKQYYENLQGFDALKYELSFMWVEADRLHSQCAQLSKSLPITFTQPAMIRV